MSQSGCGNCASAAANALWGGYSAGCEGCKVRMIASGPQFWACNERGRIDQGYRTVMKAAFGDDWPAKHELVKQAYGRMVA